MSTQHFTIRDATLADIPAISAIGAATFAASFGYSMPTEDLEAYLAASYAPASIKRDFGSTNTDHFFVSTSTSTPSRVRTHTTADDSENFAANGQQSTESIPAKEHVIGFVQIKLGTTEPCLPKDVPLVEINRIYVSQNHLGSGAGKALMVKALDFARMQVSEYGPVDQQRRAILWLGVWEENLKAQRFYERFGFEKVGKHDFRMGETVQTDWILMKRL